MSISKEEVKNIANLSRLYLTDEDLEKYSSDLSSIVEFVNTLNEVDTEGVKPTDHILDIKNVFRKDELKPSYDREELFKNAPTKEAGCISVPKTVE